MSPTTTVTTSTSAKILAWVKRWIRQPTTVFGIMALVGDLSAVLTGAATWQLELPIAFGGLIGMLLPDNTGLPTLATSTLRDLLAAVKTGDAASIEALEKDAEAILAVVPPLKSRANPVL